MPRERALADATVMADWLTAEQRTHYAPRLRAGDDLGTFVEHLADERRVVLEEGADPVADEVDSAREAEQAARQWPLRSVEAGLLVIMVACMIILIILTVREDTVDIPLDPGLALMITAAGALALVIAAAVGALATRRRDRALLDWAVSRPGQLGRGIPVRHALQTTSVAPMILMTMGPALLIAGSVITAATGAAVLLIALLPREGETLIPMATGSLVIGIAALPIALVWSRLYMRRLEQRVRRHRAAEWLGHHSEG